MNDYEPRHSAGLHWIDSTVTRYETRYGRPMPAWAMPPADLLAYRPRHAGICLWYVRQA